MDRSMRARGLNICTFSPVGWWGLGILALAHPAASADVADLSLSQLSEVRVTSVSRRDERLDQAAASVYVIGGEDIRRSGARTLPEALRLAPQLNVARADANQYAINARGFNNVQANKMLVLIDGRTVYSPLFSGVFWDAQDVLIEDIERIEVVSGPSTALWGTNAVNGLIHVITRSAARTQGAGAAMHVGNRERGASARYGATTDSGAHYRIYAKGYGRDDTEKASGESVLDEADGAQSGFRADWRSGGEQMSVHGDIYRSRAGEPANRRQLAGVNLMANWMRTLPDGANVTVQTYLERTELELAGVINNALNTLDVVAQYDMSVSAGHRVILGAGHRRSSDRNESVGVLGFEPAARHLQLSRVFAQYQAALSERVALGMALSLEHNQYTGVEALPSVRLSYAPQAGQLAWASASRAVRLPSRLERDLYQPAQPPYTFVGNPQFQSEVANVFELGYRAQPSVALSYAVTLFYQRYDRLRSIGLAGSALQFVNDVEGYTRGLEGWLSWQVHERWKLSAGGSTLRRSFSVDDGGSAIGGTVLLGNDPSHHWSLRSAVDFSPRVSWDTSLRRTAALPDPQVPSYVALDMRWAWSPDPDWEIALVLENLTDRRHAEWGGAANRVEFGRSALLQLRWRL